MPRQCNLTNKRLGYQIRSQQSFMLVSHGNCLTRTGQCAPTSYELVDGVWRRKDEPSDSAHTGSEQGTSTNSQVPQGHVEPPKDRGVDEAASQQPHTASMLSSEEQHHDGPDNKETNKNSDTDNVLQGDHNSETDENKAATPVVAEDVSTSDVIPHDQRVAAEAAGHSVPAAQALMQRGLTPVAPTHSSV